ncbi:MAG: EamA family transporter [Gemmataceae bacterium]
MERWIIFAVISMVFAGLTAVIAKHGLTGISSELGLAVRTCFVSVFVLGFAAVVVPREQVGVLTRHNLFWLGLSGVTTAVSWVFYYKALKDGEVSTVALIDKGSFVVAVLLAWLVLGERITLRVALGSLLILAGLAVVSRK